MMSAYSVDTIRQSMQLPSTPQCGLLHKLFLTDHLDLVSLYLPSCPLF